MYVYIYIYKYIVCKYVYMHLCIGKFYITKMTPRRAILKQKKATREAALLGSGSLNPKPYKP